MKPETSSNAANSDATALTENGGNAVISESTVRMPIGACTVAATTNTP